MKNYLFAPALVLTLALSSCSEEPDNLECDIEEACIAVDDWSTIFTQEDDMTKRTSDGKDLTYVTDSIGFKVKHNANITTLPLQLKVTEGATVELQSADGQWEPFSNGSQVDFSGEQIRLFRITSQSGTWHREYRICVVHDTEATKEQMVLSFNFDGNYALNDPTKTNDDKGCYYIWTETDEQNTTNLFGNESWKCGNPGFKLSKSSAKPLEYPSIPVIGGGPDGTDCVKLETMDTGAFGKMVDMRIASGSLFSGYFDVANALKNARKATQFGLPFCHKPVKFNVWLKCEIGATYQDKQGNAVSGVTDEPDAYVVIYRNQDEDGKSVLLDGDDVLTSKYIVGMARLPHNYYYEEEDGRTVRRDLVGNSPIHGVTSEWKQFSMDIEYYEPLDDELLMNKGYNLIIGFASSWQGAYFTGAIGTKLWIDNVEIECEY